MSQACPRVHDRARARPCLTFGCFYPIWGKGRNHLTQDPPAAHAPATNTAGGSVFVAVGRLVGRTRGALQLQPSLVGRVPASPIEGYYALAATRAAAGARRW